MVDKLGERVKSLQISQSHRCTHTHATTADWPSSQPAWQMGLKMDRNQQGGLSYGKERISKGNNADSVGSIRH